MDATPSPLGELVLAIAKRLGRKSSESEPVLAKLREHWIDSLWHWAELTPELKASIGLPAALRVELDRMAPSKENRAAWLLLKGKSVSLTLGGGDRYEVGYGEPLSALLAMFPGGQPAALYSEDAVAFAPTTAVSLAVAPGGRLVIGPVSYKIVLGPHPTASLAWLQSLRMGQYSAAFTAFGLDDFFALPFVSAAALTSIGITDDAHMTTLLNAVRDLRALSPVEFVCVWLRHLGCKPSTLHSFRERKLDLHALLERPLDSLLEGCGDEPRLREIIDAYKGFSSVEETFHWLRGHGFDKYAFHFARYNIPFYALPCVNFFIIDEMGVTHDDELLLEALQALKQCAYFDVRAVTFWLRDLELERYGVAFASNGLVTLQHITDLTEAQMERLVDVPNDRVKLQTGIREMKEFHFYYLATASLLQELGMERYSQLFALHGISIDVLPWLTERQLVDMGITAKADRKKILAAIERIKPEVPAPLAGGAMGGTTGAAAMYGGGAATFKRPQAQNAMGYSQQAPQPPLAASSASVSPAVSANKSTPPQPPSPVQQPSPSQQAATRRSVFTDDKSLQELLSYVYGTPTLASPGAEGGARKKGRKKKGKNRSGPTTPAKSAPASAPVKEAEEEAAAAVPSQVPADDVELAATSAAAAAAAADADAAAAEEELDPLLKAQVDGEVEEFRRRLEAAGQSTKAKLTPIFYLGVEEKKQTFL